MNSSTFFLPGDRVDASEQGRTGKLIRTTITYAAYRDSFGQGRLSRLEVTYLITRKAKKLK